MWEQLECTRVVPCRGRDIELETAVTGEREEANGLIRQGADGLIHARARASSERRDVVVGEDLGELAPPLAALPLDPERRGLVLARP